MQSAPQTRFEQMREEKLDSVFASTKHPIGKSFSRKYNLPEWTQSQAFGVKTLSSEEARNLIRPDKEAEETPEVKNQYKVSHRAYEPMEQKRRNYDWSSAGINPESHVFGRLDKERLPEGVGTALTLMPHKDESVSIPKVVKREVQLKKSLQDKLGRARQLGTTSAVPSDFAFGKATTGLDEGGVESCLQNELHPDDMYSPDLGRSLTPGFRNIPPADNRAFGTPTIRTDIPKPVVRSMSDTQNYGGETTASELLCPSRFVEKGVDSLDFVQPRNADDIRDLFEEIGFVFSDEEFERMWAAASQGRDFCDVATFRDVCIASQ
eukprot:TRINITY_DN779822_c0_g1_i1.p1 TRINITY_DN779822_c0_g1~~TRINITY_DN779822_c0_g1_i1.p1  ORF type:complete len:322 (-),score=91.30 TRINITY_DN779822_c0_g1_i1:206-1171(-)